MLKYLSILAVCFYGTHSQVIIEECTNLQRQTDFQVDRFLGTWYEAKSYPSANQANTACVEENFSRNQDGTIHVDMKWRDILNNQQQNLQRNAKITCDGCFEIIDMPIPIGTNAQGAKALAVLETDYDDYAVVYTCDEAILQVRGNVLTRSRNPSIEVLNKAMGALSRNNLSPGLLRNSNQNNCS